MSDQLKKFLAMMWVAIFCVAASVHAQTPPSKAPQQGQPSTKAWDEYCSRWHEFNPHCGDVEPAETVRMDLREEAFKAIICKAVCDPVQKRNPPMSADVVALVGSTATVETVRHDDKKGTGNNPHGGFFLSFTPTPNTDTVHVLVSIGSAAESVRFDDTLAIHPGGTATLGNGTWQIVISRTE